MPEVCRAKVEVAVGVDGARLDHHQLRRFDEPAVVVRDLAEVARDVTLQPSVALLAVVAAQMPVEERDVLAIGIGLDDRSRSRAQAARMLTSRSSPIRAAKALSNASGCPSTAP